MKYIFFLIIGILILSCSDDSNDNLHEIKPNEWIKDINSEYISFKLKNRVDALRKVTFTSSDKTQEGEIDVGIAYNERTFMTLDYGFKISVEYLFLNYGMPFIKLDGINLKPYQDFDVFFNEDHCFIIGEYKEYIYDKLISGEYVTIEMSVSDNKSRYEVNFKIYPYNFNDIINM